MSPSRSPTIVMVAACAQHRLGLMAGIDPAARFLVLERALGVRALDPALAGVDLAAHQPQARLPLSASTATIACTSRPRPEPFPISPRPRRRPGLVLKLISLVSWMASTCRPAAASIVCSLQPSIKRSTVTFSLARKRPKATSRARLPWLSSRRQTDRRTTMRSSSTAPFCRDGYPRTGRATDFQAT